jgi:hypothetical protein
MFLKRANALSMEVPFLSSLGKLLDGDIEVNNAVRMMVEAYEA